MIITNVDKSVKEIAEVAESKRWWICLNHKEMLE
jgi:hypothetical protein